MQLLNDNLVVSPTDLTKHIACDHMTTLNLQAARGERVKPEDTDATLAVLYRRGLEHEAKYLQRLRDEGREIAEIEMPEVIGRAELRRAERQTRAAMRAGADVIYQATFFDGLWRGHADFLLKRDDRPGRWDWSYDIADTKLARKLKVPALQQMAVYANRLSALQHVEPEQLIVVTGDQVGRTFRYADAQSYARVLQQNFLDTIAQPPGTSVTRPEPVPACVQCVWEAVCSTQWREEDHLKFVAGISRSQRERLVAGGISTLRELGTTPAERLPSNIQPAIAARLADQARLQLVERETGKSTYEVLGAEEGRGLARLPEPSHGDIFLDIEGDPFEGDNGLEYLWVALDAEGPTPFWGTSPDQEKANFERVVDHLMAAWEADPDLHIYHYAPYEPDRLKKLSARHNTRTEDVDRLLRGERLVDLYSVVKQGLRVSKESYSLKSMEDFYWGSERPHGEEVSDALGSVVAFEEWLQTGDGDRNHALLAQIEEYCIVDCRSLIGLRDWLERLRAETGGNETYGPRPVHSSGHSSESAAELADEISSLRAGLTGHLSPDDVSDEAQARRLLADLLDWHRREAMPEWWDHFARLNMSDDELLADTAAVAGLGKPQWVDSGPRSEIWRMEFPPQETKLTAGASSWLDPRTGKAVGTVVAIDAQAGWLELKRASNRGAPDCTSLMPGRPIADKAHRERLRDLAQYVIDNSVEGGVVADREGRWLAARDLLLGAAPRLRTGADGPLRRPDESALDAVKRVAAELDGGVLPIQGPPGTGKTYVGARMIVELLATGNRVGISALSHQAISNLLEEVSVAAAEAGVELHALQKASETQACTVESIGWTDEPAAVERRLAADSPSPVNLVAGTSWLFSRAGMADQLDYLVVDEASQLSLANALAISHSARNVVLLGDPQQLAQPVRGTHPKGADASALQHLLAGRATVADDRGILLDETWRMHPKVASFVSKLSYEGRLGVAPGREHQRVRSASQLGGTGLRFLPVEHTGNTSSSMEEVREVTRLIYDVLRDGRYIDFNGESRRMQPSDVLVVTPYNAQVGLLREYLYPLIARGLRVGTVDSYQGQEAPVVLYSMAASSADLSPRGAAFLYDLHRFTSAVSRARAVAAVVASPALLTTPVNTGEQLRQVNALCRFAELSRPASRRGVEVAPAIRQRKWQLPPGRRALLYADLRELDTAAQSAAVAGAAVARSASVPTAAPRPATVGSGSGRADRVGQAQGRS